MPLRENFLYILKAALRPAVTRRYREACEPIPRLHVELSSGARACSPRQGRLDSASLAVLVHKPTTSVAAQMRSRSSIRRSGNEQAAGGHPARWPSVAGVALIAAVPVATWWAVGDLSTDLPDPDYQIRPLDLGRTTAQVAGVSATVLAAAAVVALVGAGRAGRFDRRWWPVLVELVLAGALCGAGWRVLTAGVIGANIGAGLVLLVGAPIVAALVGLAVFDWLTLRAQRQHPGPNG